MSIGSARVLLERFCDMFTPSYSFQLAYRVNSKEVTAMPAKVAVITTFNIQYVGCHGKRQFQGLEARVVEALGSPGVLLASQRLSSL